MKTNQNRIEWLVRELLAEIGEDPGREGLADTPVRVAKALAFLTSGYRKNAEEEINGAVFSTGSNDMVIVRELEEPMD